MKQENWEERYKNTFPFISGRVIVDGEEHEGILNFHIEDFIRQERNVLLESIRENLDRSIRLIDDNRKFEKPGGDWELGFNSGLSVAISIIDSGMGDINK